MPHHTPHLNCPRCGYDVSGVVPTWTESCPLEGTCSECGLSFTWADIFFPDRLWPRWSFEHGRRASPWRAIRMAARSFRPVNFWNGMRLEARVRPARLAIFAALVVLATWATIALLWGYNGYQMATLGRQQSKWVGAYSIPEPWALMVEYALCPMGDRGGWWAPQPVTAPVAVFVVWCLLIPVPFLAMPTTLARARCRRAHLLRAWACFLPTPAAIVLASGVYWSAIIYAWMHGTGAWLVRTQMWTYVLALPAAAWCVWWWRQCVGRYLRLEQPTLTTAMMMIASLLCAVAVVVYLPGEGLINDAGAVLLYWFK